MNTKQSPPGIYEDDDGRVDEDLCEDVNNVPSGHQEREQDTQHHRAQSNNKELGHHTQGLGSE